tara:strand:- start:285 stop:587 length:303 start_codon:yes stop_codon:yes gene_type:complete
MSKLSPGEFESLNQLRKVSGTGGFKYLAITTAHANLNGYAVVVNTDAKFSKFWIDGVDRLAKLGLTASIVVKAGSYLPVPEGSVITDITMAEGDCIIYNL